MSDEEFHEKIGKYILMWIGGTAVTQKAGAEEREVRIYLSKPKGETDYVICFSAGEAIEFDSVDEAKNAAEAARLSLDRWNVVLFDDEVVDEIVKGVKEVR